MERRITSNARYNRRAKSAEKNITILYNRVKHDTRKTHERGLIKMGQTPINTIGGGGRMRRCTANAADILDDIALAIWAEHKGELRKIGMRKPASSIAIDCLIYHAVKNGCIDVKGPLTPKNNLYLAIIV